MTYYKFKVTEQGYTETGWDSQGNQESYQFIADPNSYAKRITQVIPVSYTHLRAHET